MINRKGQILIESVIFIILNVTFLVILVLFLVKQGNGAVLMEDGYSKQIALLIDSAPPGTIILVNLEEGLTISKEKGIPFENVVKIKGNQVLVNLTGRGGKEYSFFNNVSVNNYIDKINGDPNGVYVFAILKKGATENE